MTAAPTITANWPDTIGVQFRVLLGLGTSGDGNAIWDTALWDTDEWSGGETSWQDVTQFALSVETKFGRDQWLADFRTGNCNVVLNNQTGLFNPSAGQPLPGVLVLRPGRSVRIEGNAGQGWIPIFTGYINAINDEYTAAAHGINSRIQGIGFFGPFAIDHPLALVPPNDIPPGQLTSDRITQILDTYGWPLELRDIQVGVHTMQASTLPGTTLTELKNAQNAEGGAVFCNQAGEVVFKSRDWLDTDPRSTTVQYQLGGVFTGSRMLSVTPIWDANRIINDAQLQRNGAQTGVRAQDPSSQALYRTRTFKSLSVECETDAQLQVLADRIVASLAFDKIRIDAVEVWPSTNVAAQNALNTRIGDLIRVTVLTGEAWSYTIDTHVQNIGHRITADDWEITMRIDDSVSGPTQDGTVSWDELAFNDEAYF